MPKSVEDAAKKDGLKLKPDEKPVTTGDVGGDLGDLLGTNDPATAGAEPKPATAAQISPQQVEQFKTQARNLLRQQGVPPDQIESRVNAMIVDAQRANTTLADSAAHTPAKPETTPGPAPADTRSWGEKLGDKFNDFVNEAHDQFYNRIDSTVETLQNLTGLGGEGHPGVRESWQQLGEAALQQHKDDPLHLRSPIGPLGPWGAVNDVIHDIPEMIDNPGKYAGDKAFDATAMAVTMPLGGEGALGRALFPELGALERSALPGAGHTLEHAAPPAVPHTPDSSPVVPHTPDSSPVVPHTPDPPAAPHTAEPPAAPRTAEASPVPHSAEPVVPHSAEPPPVPHSAEPVVPHSAEPPPVEHHHPSADASPEHHAPDPDHADFTPPPIEHHDAGGGSTYKERIDQTPINNGHWMGERGESKWISQNPDVNRFLDEANVDGIHHSNGQPDFSPVAKGQVEIPDMTTNRDYNFKVADKLLAQEWGVSPRDIAEWRSDNKYTWHEEPDLKTMQLVPSIVNNRLGHVGGIGELNAGKTLPPPMGEGGP
ncbi:HNH endonuclease [Mycolicibacterium fortuitum]|uniref:HNH endonuclease n=1 Tax=Mycolicibacterium fortuitum TaxID=1766 RepID=UPI001CDC77B4|nr:HNH endonuclease [Mycolicibacterium fortuitum]UBV23935.1 HNH endonuclease [Mycolicibacterium fortuitum]